MSYETRYAAVKRQQARDRDNRPEAVREHLNLQRACELARAETAAKFPEVTADTFQAAAAYQDERIAFHRAALAKVTP